MKLTRNWRKKLSEWVAPRRRRSANQVSRSPAVPGADVAVATTAARGAGANGEPGPTTGLHVPRRTHRRKGAAAKTYRHPWANPILWRELMTRAYGARPLIIKGCYVLLFVLGMGLFFNLGQEMENPLRSTLGLIPIGLAILSLVLVNAQGVTSITSERDTGALDLLLVSELSPKEFIYGKLYGVLYNSKEMIALPVLTAIGMFVARDFLRRKLGAFSHRFLAALPFLGNARTARRDHLYQQPHRGGQQPGDDLLSHDRHLALCVLDRA